jgi:hypothetical protein
MKRSTNWLRLGTLLVVCLVLLWIANLRMTDPMPAATAAIDNANLTFVSLENSDGIFGGHAKVTFANPKNAGEPVVVELLRRPWSRNWVPLAEK